MDTDTYIELNRIFCPIKDDETDLETTRLMADFGYGKAIYWEDLLQKPRVVILAEPGTGKTEELQAVTNRLRSKGVAAFFWRIELLEDLDIRKALDIGTGEEFNNWLSGEQEGFFFLDSVDEAHLKGNLIFEKALRHFGEEIRHHLERIKVFVTCRVSDWRTSKDLYLFQKFLPKPQAIGLKKENESAADGIHVNHDDDSGKDNERDEMVFQLLPLNGHQIAYFAKEKGIKDVKGFMAAIERENAMMFAERPQDLLELIGYWKSNGCFGHYAEMIEFNIQNKLRERDPDRERSESLSLEDSYEGAERIAAALTFRRKNTIILPDESVNIERSGVSIDSKNILVNWPPIKIKRLLERPIFDVAIYGTVQFHHRIVREYLTAKWLKRLLESGKSHMAVEKLFFANMYGVNVVIPSMEPILAWLSLWNEQIRIRVKKIAPEILIEHGDPSSLPLDFRESLLNSFTKKYAERKHTGISFKIEMLRRLADPQLAPKVNELLDCYSDHTDISYMLLILIWQGQMTESFDRALSYALNEQADRDSRIWALKAIAAIGTPEQHRNLVDKLMEVISKLDLLILEEFCESYFPGALSVHQLLKIVETRKSSKTDYSNALERSLDRIADKSLSEEMVKEILQGFYKLLKQPSFIPESCCQISECYLWLLPVAIKFANYFISKKDVFSLEKLTLDIFLGYLNVNKYHCNSTQTDEIEKVCETAKAWSEFRINLFWHAITTLRVAREKEKNNRIIGLWQIRLIISDFLTPDVNDLERFFEALMQRPFMDDRLVALSVIFRIYIETKRPRQLLKRMKQAVKGNFELEDSLNKSLEERMNSLCNQRSRNRIAAQQKSQQDDITLKQRQEIIKKSEEIKNVGNLEKIENFGLILYLYDRISKKKGGSQLGISNWQSLIEDFNYEVANNFREGCTAYWRKYDPLSDKQVIAFLRGDSNTIPWPLIIGLTGLAMEANEPEQWAKQLSLDEARIVANYSICELNGFPDWFSAVRNAFPAIVDEVIMEELKWEFQKPAKVHSARILSFLAYNETEINEYYQEKLVDLLLRTEPINAEAIENVLSILLSRELEDCLREKATEQANKYFENSQDENLKIEWLKFIFCIDGFKGLDIIKQWLNDISSFEGKKDFMVKFCANLMGHRDERLNRNNTRDFHRIEILSELVPIIYQYVRPEDDNHHRGVFTPNMRDNAERTSSRLLNILVDTPGYNSYNTLVNLSTSGSDSVFRDHMDNLSKQRAALDAEYEPWTEDKIREFENVKDSSEKHNSQDYIHLLHLSDLHFKGDTSPDEKLQWLENDIRKGECLGFNEIEYLVISGDFTDRSERAGFEQAREFISRLMSKFGIAKERCILVPGNHDIELNMDPKGLKGFPDLLFSKLTKLIRKFGIAKGRCILVPSNHDIKLNTDPKGLKGFSDLLFSRITNIDYPLEPTKQAQSYLYSDDCLQFIALNSGWEIDRDNRDRASINSEALAYILGKSQQEMNDAINSEVLDKNQRMLRIAVFHHPVTQHKTMREQQFIEHLQKNNIKLILHGDIHVINREDYEMWKKSNIYIIGGGSFGKVDDRPDCTPRLYNLLEIKKDFSKIRVHTRKQPKIDGAWEGCHEWPDPIKDEARLPYFDIYL